MLLPNCSKAAAVNMSGLPTATLLLGNLTTEQDWFNDSSYILIQNKYQNGGAGYLIGKTIGSCATESYAYDLCGRIISVTDPTAILNRAITISWAWWLKSLMLTVAV